jgi:hypothetical protein
MLREILKIETFVYVKSYIHPPTHKPNKMEMEATMFAAYMEGLNDKERKAMEIARDHLGTSFNLKKSNGFVQFKAKWKPPTPTPEPTKEAVKAVEPTEVVEPVCAPTPTPTAEATTVKKTIKIKRKKPSTGVATE